MLSVLYFILPVVTIYSGLFSYDWGVWHQMKSCSGKNGIDENEKYTDSILRFLSMRINL